MSSTSSANPSHDVAIVGLAGVFPGALDVRQFWRNIVGGVDAISDIPAGRWHFGDNHHLPHDHASFVACSRGGFLPPELRIDPARYGVVPRLISEGDADQFLILHVVDAALADAGVPADAAVRRRTDLVIGRGGHCTARQLEVGLNTEVIPWVRRVLGARFPELGGERLEAIERELRARMPEDSADSISTAIPNLTASRAANRLDLRGAAYVVDAACASSLIAVEQLVHRLRLGLCDLGVAGGISLNQNPSFWTIFTRLGAISPSGQCRPFDRRANGLVLGEAAGAVVLKRLADACRDGDQIYAIIKGAGSSSDGREAGLLAPTTAGQVESLRAAYRDASVDPATIGYLEAHGTATGLGDAAEIATIKTIFGTDRTGPMVRPMGSIKSMIGHSLPAAGIASLIKTALALSNKILPPSLHCDEPHADLAGAPFYVNAASRSWIHSPSHHPRRAGVNSFGFGGINCHVVLEEVPESAAVPTAPFRGTSGDAALPEHHASLNGDSNHDAGGRHAPQPRPIVVGLERETELIALAGPTRSAMVEQLTRLRDFLTHDREATLADVAFSLAESIDLDQPCRLALIAKNRQQLSELAALAGERLSVADLPVDQIEDRETIYYADDAARQHGRLAMTFPPMGFPPGLFGNYPDRLLQLCLHFPDVRREFDLIELRDEHPQDPIPTSALLVPPPTVSALDKRLFRARFTPQKLAPEGEEMPPVRPDDRNLASLGVTLSNWVSWVLVRPLEIPVDMLCGQSQGDMAALCVAGAIEYEALAKSFWDSLEVPPSYAARGHLALVGGISAEQLTLHFAAVPDVAIAIHAGRKHMVIGGSAVAIGQLAERLKPEGITIQNFPYPPIHTPRLSYMREELSRSADLLQVSAPRIPTYCSTSAELFPSEPAAIRSALLDNLDKAILWWQTYQKMYDDGARIFLQAGGTVANSVDTVLKATDKVSLSVDVSFRDPLTQLNHVCAGMLTTGCHFRLTALHRGRDVRRIDLDRPSAGPVLSPLAMPLRLDPSWFNVEPPPATAEPEAATIAAPLPTAVPTAPAAPAVLPPGPAQPCLPLLGEVIYFAAGSEIVVDRLLTLAEDRYLADHHFINAAGCKPMTECLPVMPMAMALEMIAEVASQLAPGLQFSGFENVRALRWLVMEDTDSLPVRAKGRLVSVDPASGVHAVEVSLFAPGQATANTTATVLFGPERRQDISIAFSQIQQSESWWFTAAEVYDEHLMFHGPTFHGISGLGALADTGCTVELTVPSDAGLFASTSLPLLLTNPCIMDALSQTGGVWALARFADIYLLPVGVEKVEYYRDNPAPGTRVAARIEVTHFDVEQKEMRIDVELGDGEGYVWMRCQGFTYRSFNMINRVIAVRRRPERYCASVERPLPHQPAGPLCMLVTRDFLRDIPADWIARIYLHSDEMTQFRELGPYPARQREWLMGRLAAKDVVRNWFFQRHPEATELIHPAAIILDNDERGRPVVQWIAGSEARPEISISHNARGAFAAAADVSVGVDMALASPQQLELWESFTTPGERQLFADVLHSQPEESWATRLWCAKEAVGKALGIGLAGRPRDFQATAASTDGRIEVVHAPSGEVFSVSTDRDGLLLLALTVRGPLASPAPAAIERALGRQM